MRMRKLGRGQSVAFLVPPEVRQRMRMRQSPCSNRKISSADVLEWSISETWDDCRSSIRLWAAQGIRFQVQEARRERADKAVGGRTKIPIEQAAEFLEKDC